jgi:hypothetical protein
VVSSVAQVQVEVVGRVCDVFIGYAERTMRYLDSANDMDVDSNTCFLQSTFVIDDFGPA